MTSYTLSTYCLIKYGRNTHLLKQFVCEDDQIPLPPTIFANWWQQQITGSAILNKPKIHCYKNLSREFKREIRLVEKGFIRVVTRYVFPQWSIFHPFFLMLDPQISVTYDSWSLNIEMISWETKLILRKNKNDPALKKIYFAEKSRSTHFIATYTMYERE